MTKKIIITTFNEKTGDQELTMSLTLKNPIDGNTFKERKEYVQPIAKKQTSSKKYIVQWKDPFGVGGMEGYSHGI